MDVFVNGTNNNFNGFKICHGNLFPLSEYMLVFKHPFSYYLAAIKTVATEFGVASFHEIGLLNTGTVLASQDKTEM
jgi:hypothetical protein